MAPTPAPHSAQWNSSDPGLGPFPFSYYKYFPGASTQSHELKYHLYSDDSHVNSLIWISPPTTSEHQTGHLISITELSQKYLKLDKREKEKLGKCEQCVKAPEYMEGLMRKKANGHRVLRAGLTIEISRLHTSAKTRPGCYEKVIEKALALRKFKYVCQIERFNVRNTMQNQGIISMCTMKWKQDENRKDKHRGPNQAIK